MMGDPLMRAICTDPTNNPAWVTRQLTGVSGDMAGVSGHSTVVSGDIAWVSGDIAGVSSHSTRVSVDIMGDSARRLVASHRA